jgi:hypothetical protein
MDFDNDDDDDDFFDSGQEPFDPAKSVLSNEGNEDRFHLACVCRYIELYQQQYPAQNIDYEQLKNSYYFNSNIPADWYIERIIRHYYYCNEPFEEDIMPVDENNFPSKEEIKRFLDANNCFIEKAIFDQFLNPQPIDCEKEVQLVQLQQYFKILKAEALRFYPQIEKLPARGFRELERNLYTINYLRWIKLHEFKDRLLGLNKDYFDEIDRKKKEENDDMSSKKNIDDKILKIIADHCFFDIAQKWRELGIDEKLKANMCNRLCEEMTDKYLEIYPQYNLPRLDFLAKVKTECLYEYQNVFSKVHGCIEHYRTSDEPYTKKRIIYRESKEYKHYKELVKLNKSKQEIDNYINSLEYSERDYLQFEFDIEAMCKTMLKVIYETFPEIINLSAGAMVEINTRVFSLARFNLKQLNAVCNLVLKEHTQNH